MYQNLTEVSLVSGASGRMQHGVGHLAHVLGRVELELPQPVQEVGPAATDGLRCYD